MTFEKLWAQLCQKKPMLSDKTATVEINVVAFKSLLRQCYEQGEKAAAETARTQPNPLDIFDFLRGGK